MSALPAWFPRLALSAAFTLTSMWVPIWLSVRQAAHRPRFALRAAGVVAVFCASPLLELAVQSPADVQLDQVMGPTGTYALAPLVLFALFPLVCWVLYDVSPGDAMFVSAQGYALQNLASGLNETCHVLWGGPLPGQPASTLVALAWYAGVYLAFFGLVLHRQGCLPAWRSAGRTMVVTMALVMFLVIFFDEVIKACTLVGLPIPYVLALRAVHVGTCLFVLWSIYQLAYNQQLRMQMAAERSLRAEEERRWELSRQNVEAINIKCHDIRHQIRQLRDGSSGTVDAGALDDIEREVEVYDSQVRTGNAALDTVLSEKRLVCDQAGVELSVMADGTALAGMPPADLYSLFGNALDNAIEAARKVPEMDRRYILVTVRRSTGMVAVHVENSFTGPSPTFEDGLPRTTKEDATSHGFGTLSMRRTAERYGGTLALAAHDGTFTLDALLAVPES